MRINAQEAKEMAPVIGRQSVLGFLIGVMPGAGATIASLMGYAMERVPAGSFQMGSARGRYSERPLHGVTITQDFYIGRTERECRRKRRQEKEGQETKVF